MKYLTFAKIDQYGRTGNSLWEVAAVIGLAKRHGFIPLIPHRWQYRKYCNLPDEYFGDKTPDEVIKETQHHFIPDLLKNARGNVVSIEGCFQSTKYFTEIQEDIKRWFRPKESDNYGEWSVGVHIRRGDYVGHPCYAQYDADWYKAIMHQYFHDPRYVFYICSDDMDYVAQHFPCDEKHIFAKRSVVSDLVVLTSCKHFILSGSSFSFWGAYLSAQPGGTIIRPPRTHTGPLSHLIEDDIWPDNFIPYSNEKLVTLACNVDDPTDEKIDLTDLTFIIPVSYDSNSRQENVDIVLAYLLKRFNTNIIVGEINSNRYFSYVERLGIQYIYFNDIPGFFQEFNGSFHRTRALNFMTMMAHTPYIANWDADVLIDPYGIEDAVKLLRQGNPIVYPYDGAFLRVDAVYKQVVKHTLAVNPISGIPFKGRNDRSVGGAFMFNKEKYFTIGLENENFISHAPEDIERFRRSSMFYDIKRVDYPLYHLYHDIKENSCHAHEFMVFNNTEWRRVKSLNKEQYMEYINSWRWISEYKQRFGYNG